MSETVEIEAISVPHRLILELLMKHYGLDRRENVGFDGIPPNSTKCYLLTVIHPPEKTDES